MCIVLFTASWIAVTQDDVHDVLCHFVDHTVNSSSRARVLDI